MTLHSQVPVDSRSRGKIVLLFYFCFISVGSYGLYKLYSSKNDQIALPANRPHGNILGDHQFRHPGRTGSIDFSPDGSLASGGKDGIVIIWDTAIGKPKLKFQAHRGIVESVSFSADGKLLASSGSKTIVVCDPFTGKEIWKHTLTKDNAGKVVFSPKGSYLAFFGARGSIRLWDISQKRLLISSENVAPGEYISFSPDNSYVAFGPASGKPAILWDLKTLKKVDPKDLGFPERVEFLADGDHVISRVMTNVSLRSDIPKRGIFHYWEQNRQKRTKKLKFTYEGKKNPVIYHHHSISPDSNLIAIVGTYKARFYTSGYRKKKQNKTGLYPAGDPDSFETRVYGTGTHTFGDFQKFGYGRPRRTYLLDLKRRSLSGLSIYEGEAQSVAFSRDGKILATAGPDSIRLWNPNSNGKILATAGPDSIRLWNPKRELFPPKGHTRMVDCVKFSPDGRYLASSGNDAVLLWNLQDLENPQYQKLELFHNVNWPSTLSWLKDDSRSPELSLFALTFSKNIRIPISAFSENSEMTMNEVFSAYVEFIDTDAPIERQGKAARSIAFSLFQQMHAAVIGYSSYKRSHDKRRDGFVLPPIWAHTPADPGEIPIEFVGDMDVFSVQFSPDNNHLVLAGYDKVRKLPVLRIYKTVADTGVTRGNSRFINGEFLKYPRNRKNGNYLRLIEVSKNKEDHIESLVFMPDGKHVVVGGKKFVQNPNDQSTAKFKGLVEIWNITTGKRQRTFDVPATVRCVACSPDGKLIATACKDNLARIYDAKTGNLVAKLEGHRGSVRSVDFSPDGKLIATGSADTTVMLWDTEKMSSGK